MFKTLGAVAASLALLATDVRAGKLTQSLKGSLPWSTKSGEMICDGELDSDRAGLSEQAKGEFAIMADGWSTVPGGPTMATYTTAYSRSLVAERFGADEVDWNIMVRRSTKAPPPSLTQKAWLGLRAVGATKDMLLLMIYKQHIYPVFWRPADNYRVYCFPKHNDASTRTLSSSAYKKVNVHMTATELSMTIDGVSVCVTKKLTGSNALLTAAEADVAWGPPRNTPAFPMVISRLTSPYPRVDRAMCTFSDDIQVRYCSVPRSPEMFGLLASQTGEAGALRYERNGALPTDKGRDFTVNFGEAGEDLDSLTTLEVFAESHKWGTFYAQCIRQVLFKRDGKMVPVADFSPGVFVMGGKADNTDGSSKMVAVKSTSTSELAWMTLRTVPLSMLLEFPLRTVKLSWRACSVYGAGFSHTTKIHARALVINPSSDRFEYTEWLIIPGAKQNDGEVRDKIFWTIERPFTELLFVEFSVDGDSTNELSCIDYVSLDGKPAREMSSSWIAPANWQNTMSPVKKRYCNSYGCKEVARAIFEYAVCGVEILGAKPSGEIVQSPVDDETVVTASCSNYNRFSQQSCSISQDIVTSSSSATTVETGDEYAVAIGQSESDTEEDNWSVSASLSVEKEAKVPLLASVKVTASVTAGGGGSSSSTTEKSKETTTTESNSEGITHASEESYTVNCAAEADVPAGAKQGYELRLKKTEYTQEYTTDLKLKYCPETWEKDTDANDPANYRILAGIPSSSRLTETMMCEVVFNAPVPVRNAMKCNEEAAEAMLNGLDRFVNCQDDDAEKYDGCMCDAMNKLTEDACICVDEGGTAIKGTMTFMSGTWQETCTRMNCANSKFGDGSGNAVPAPATAQSSATNTMMDNYTSAKAPLAAVGVIAMLALCVAMYALRARSVSQRSGTKAEAKAAGSSSAQAYGAVQV